MKDDAVLCVGNFDSGTGYAWRLIELLWINISLVTKKKYRRCIVIYPSITNINLDLINSNICVEAFKFETKNIIGINRTLKFIIKNRIKVLYLTDYPVISLSYFMFRLVGVKKIIVHDHTPGYRHPVNSLKKIIKIILNNISIITADAVIGVSPYVCSRLEAVNCFPKKKIYSVTNGISDTDYIKNYNYINKIIYIVTVSRINQYKGLDFSIRVMQILINEFNIKNIIYEIVGDGPELGKFKKLTKKLGLNNYIKFLGDRLDVEEILPNYDIAFHPSKGEAMCIAIVEYMRASLAILTSTNISVNSILVKNEDALFYTESDLYSAARVLLKAIKSSRLREELGVKARVNFLNKYRSKNMIDQFGYVLEKIVSK